MFASSPGRHVSPPQTSKPVAHYTTDHLQRVRTGIHE
jgi:hypothetical protein